VNIQLRTLIDPVLGVRPVRDVKESPMPRSERRFDIRANRQLSSEIILPMTRQDGIGMWAIIRTKDAILHRAEDSNS
jgi:hypothetical protein